MWWIIAMFRRLSTIVTLGGAVIGAVLWLSVEAVTIMNSRILYFDPES